MRQYSAVQHVVVLLLKQRGSQRYNRHAWESQEFELRRPERGCRL